MPSLIKRMLSASSLFTGPNRYTIEQLLTGSLRNLIQDPLAADADANQMVLQPLQSATQKSKEEEREHGVFYDDQYNYLQHLKDRNKVEHDWSEADRFVISAGERKEDKKEKGLSLPPTVFGTKGQEEEVGLLNKAAPTGLDLSLDPDIVAALDEDFDFEDPDNCLDDDFFVNAMETGDGGASDDEWEDNDSDIDSDCVGGRSEDEEDDEVPSLQSWGGEETGTKFTNYSMSSSCIRRNNQLSLLDDKFDRFMDQYGEMEEGALEGEEIEGTIEEASIRMKELVQESEKERATARQQLVREREVQMRHFTEESGDEMEEVVVKEKGDKWDCESVLSTYSTLYNHPKMISERKPDQIKLSTKTGIPKNVLGRGLTAGALKLLDMENGMVEDDLASVRSKISEFSIRPKHETLEEKKTRKQGLKQVRKERREEKKANTLAFKAEKTRQNKININNKNNLQGIKIC